jgi:predicted N-acetyltransferase YhbS
MEYRPAGEHERDAACMMGYDTWSNGQSAADFLARCKSPDKHRSARWFVLSERGVLRASLLVHSFEPWGDRVVRGIGSVATAPEFRGHGYGRRLVAAAVADLTGRENASLVFLYSDIGPDFYARYGFAALPAACQPARASVAMVLMLPHYDETVIAKYADRVPEYF